MTFGTLRNYGQRVHRLLLAGFCRFSQAAMGNGHWEASQVCAQALPPDFGWKDGDSNSFQNRTLSETANHRLDSALSAHQPRERSEGEQ
jgi:hypothetical protein